MALPSDLLASFERWLVIERGFSKATVRTRVSTVEQFDAFSRLRRRSLTKVGPEEVKAFLDRYTNPRTRNRALADLRGFYAWAVEEGAVRLSPTRKVYRVQEPRTLPRPLARDVAAAVMKACESGRARTACAVMLYAGLRVSECASLRWEDVGERTLHVLTGKGSKERYVPCEASLRSHLERWARACIAEYGDLPEYVFPGQYLYRSINPATLWADIRKAGDRIGVHVTPHMLRHTYGTEMYRASKDIAGVATVMGHASPVPTFGYARVVAEEMASSSASLNFG